MNALERAFESCAGEAERDPRADVGVPSVEQLLRRTDLCVDCGTPVAWHRDPFTREWTGCFNVDALEARARLRFTLMQLAGGAR